ncbi:glycoside hydrolase family 1 protein [Companilactobacillus bobalius]|uniref:6-phospho-beta-glucosidase n=2 Tax=Companilactobacillus bobalius TaxID=2801451 RepID=A0A202FF79_9LACO|nr:glycoside hydrolase family 1 protein [Companilactobacillus bobalius]KAE9560411.1 hypothetical protein ATN92_09615 [Companilactobacillus bobalius]KRK83162.1 glycosyl hydrolase [Companilactobacillus bobalius DSM 19674]OVE99149.1 6-phospho-beta-glucosidase [Companilactobacillus bobalius]GEO57125.1 6-phospho-beta-glucosidase [Companilactobacillus paralimentarius]
METENYFPKDFLWGASMSAFQSEGAIADDGRKLSVADIRIKKMNQQFHTTDTSTATDFYHRYKEDIKLMAECGLRSFRFSFSWSRIFPDGNGKVNKKGVQFYDNVIDELIKYNIKPIVTLLHFDLPQSLIDQYQGFYSRESIQDFLNYAKFCFNHFGDRIPYWLTINEQDVLANIPFFNGLDNLSQSIQASHHMNIANALTMKLYHSLDLKGKIGPCLSYPTRYPASTDPRDQFLAMNLDDLGIFYLIDTLIYGKYPAYYINHLKSKGIMFKTKKEDSSLLKNVKPDFLAINWYTSEVVGQYLDDSQVDDYQGPELPRQNRSEKGVAQYYKNPYTEYGDYNWNIDGVGLRLALRKIYERYHLPLMITENGLALKEKIDHGKIHDQKRIKYLNQMIQSMSLAIKDGVKLFSYNPWSFTDVLSSSQGMDKRYGLVFIDRTNTDLKVLKRIPKDSFYWYQKCIHENGSI